MNYKYKIGDIVEVVDWGSGFSPENIGKQFIIEKQHPCYYTRESRYTTKDPGYVVTDILGKRYREACVGESSFKLIKSSCETYEIF